MGLNKRQKGGEYEKAAARFLERQGLTVLEYNYRCRLGEIDLIAQDEGYIVFVEVKYRNTKEQGWAAEAVDLRKQQRIMKVAEQFLLRKFHSVDLPCRFDVVTIDGTDVHWIRDAFWG